MGRRGLNVDATSRVFWLSWTIEVELPQPMLGEENFPLPVGLRARAQADGQFSKRSTDIPGLSAEGEYSAVAHSVNG